MCAPRTATRSRSASEAETKTSVSGIDTPEKLDSDELERDDADSPLDAAKIQALGERASTLAENLLDKVYLEPSKGPRGRYGRLAYLCLFDSNGN